MGAGIAQVFAAAGHPVLLIDANADALRRARDGIVRRFERNVQKEAISRGDADAAAARITIAGGVEALREFAPRLVIEAVPEQIDLKTALFTELDRIAGPETILASNTSSISITRLGAATTRPERVAGMHFMNPVPVMELVEIIHGERTSPAVIEQLRALTQQLGKVPVIAGDQPGFVANRILMPMINEAIFALSEGVASLAGIDTVMMLGMNHPLGPLALADYIGLDTCLAILDVLHTGFGDPKYRAAPLLRRMVAAGRVGRKCGEGFYRYTAAGERLRPDESG